MKLTKSEKCALIITLLFLCLCLGFSLGRREQDSVFVITESSYTAERQTAAADDAGAEKFGQSIEKININTASQAQLETLKGIGPALAQRIIEYRESVGQFKSIEDITKVRGIGAMVFEDIRDTITVN